MASLFPDLENDIFISYRCWYALFFLQNVKNDYDEALRQVRLAVEYDPLSSYAQTILSGIASYSKLHDAWLSC